MNKIFKGWGQHNREGSKEEGRWLFTDELVEDLLNVLRDVKANMEGKGLDFEGELGKLYADVRGKMAERYPEFNFGPKETMRPLVELEEL